MTKLSHFHDFWSSAEFEAVGIEKPRVSLLYVHAIQTVQTGIQTGIQTVVKYIQTIQTGEYAVK